MRAEQEVHAHGPHSRTAGACADSTQENTTTMKSKTKSHSRTRPLLHRSHNCDAIIAACDCIYTCIGKTHNHNTVSCARCRKMTGAGAREGLMGRVRCDVRMHTQSDSLVWQVAKWRQATSEPQAETCMARETSNWTTAGHWPGATKPRLAKGRECAP
jgi:hypothetical protein